MRFSSTLLLLCLVVLSEAISWGRSDRGHDNSWSDHDEVRAPISDYWDEYVGAPVRNTFRGSGRDRSSSSSGLSWFGGGHDRDSDSSSWFGRNRDESVPVTERLKSYLPGQGRSSDSWFGGGRDYYDDSFTGRMKSYLPGYGKSKSSWFGGRDYDDESLTSRIKTHLPDTSSKSSWFGGRDYDDESLSSRIKSHLPVGRTTDRSSWFGGRDYDDESLTSRMKSYLPGMGYRRDEGHGWFGGRDYDDESLTSRMKSYLPGMGRSDESMLSSHPGAGLANMFSRGPSADILEHPDRFQIELELPGVKNSDVIIDVNKNTIIVSGKRLTTLTEDDNASFLREERQHGAFRRVLTLSENVDASKAKADFKNGILEIEIPKLMSATSKRISVKG